MNYKPLLFICAILIIANSATAQDNWKLEKEKDGITVYSGTSSEAVFKSFKAHTLIDASIHSFVAVLLDIDNMMDWGYNLKYTELLEKSGDTLQIYYAEASAPFPFKNRDGIYRNQFYWLADSNKLVVDIQLLPEFKEADDDFIRVKGKGYWHIIVLGDGKLDVTFHMEVDPGGNIPAWLANIFVEDTPIYTLEKLKEVIRDENYQDKDYDFLN
jgi:hypothetical protein